MSEINSSKDIIQNKIKKYKILYGISFIPLSIFLVLSIIGLSVDNALKYCLIIVFIFIIIVVLFQTRRDLYIKKLRDIEYAKKQQEMQQKLSNQFVLYNEESGANEIKCGYCGGMYSRNENKCPHCGSAKH